MSLWLLVGSQKGGCGKSTVAVNICTALVINGRDVVLVDADRQSTASNWVMDRTANKALPIVHCIQKYENIRNTLLDLDKRYEYIIVDAAGHDSRELRTGMTAAHVMLLPFSPSQPDLDTLPSLQEIITQARDLNSKLIVYALLTMGPTNPVVHETDEAREYLKDYPKIRLLTTVVRDRKVYRDAMSGGMGVIEMSNRKASEEIKSLTRELLNG
ncbi:MAG: division plane positioning ATPase MipZ [Candidatus Thiodiazotropha sp.]